MMFTGFAGQLLMDNFHCVQIFIIGMVHNVWEHHAQVILFYYHNKKKLRYFYETKFCSINCAAHSNIGDIFLSIAFLLDVCFLIKNQKHIVFFQYQITHSSPRASSTQIVSYQDQFHVHHFVCIKICIFFAFWELWSSIPFLL